MAVLVSFPQSEGEGFQKGFWEGVGDVVGLRFNTQLGKIEVFAVRTWPIAGEYSGVGVCGLSIKLDGQRVDSDGDVWMEKTLHAKCSCKQGGLGEILVFCQGQEGAV